MPEDNRKQLLYSHLNVSLEQASRPTTAAAKSREPRVDPSAEGPGGVAEGCRITGPGPAQLVKRGICKEPRYTRRSPRIKRLSRETIREQLARMIHDGRERAG